MGPQEESDDTYAGRKHLSAALGKSTAGVTDGWGMFSASRVVTNTVVLVAPNNWFVPWGSSWCLKFGCEVLLGWPASSVKV